MLSSKAHNKSVELKLHLLAVANADKIFQNSVLGWKHQDKNNDPNILNVHRAIAPLKMDQEVFLVKLTLKELANNQGGRLHSLEAVSIDKEKSPIPEMTDADLKYKLTSHRHNRALIDIIVKNAQDYNRQNEKNRGCPR